MPDCDRYQHPAGYCRQPGARPYLTGWRCPACTPAALAGKPEPADGYCAPLRCHCGSCPAWVPLPAVIQIPRKPVHHQEKGAA